LVRGLLKKIAGVFFNDASDIFAPPELTEDGHSYSRKNLMNILAFTFLLLGILVFITCLGVDNNLLAHILAGVYLLALSGVIYWLNNRGHYRASAITLILGSWMATTVVILLSGAAASQYGFMYIAVIVLSSLLLEKRDAWLVAVCFVLTCLALFSTGQLLKELPVVFVSTNPFVWIYISAIIIAGTFVIQLSQRWLYGALALFRTELEARKSTEKSLSDHNAALSQLNQIGIDLTSLPEETDIYKFLCKKLKSLSGASGAVVNEYVPSKKQLLVRYLDADPDLRTAFRNTGVTDTVPMTFPMHDDLYLMMLSRVINYSKSIAEMTAGGVSEKASELYKKILGVDRFIGVAYVYEGVVYGSSVLYLKKDQPNPPEELLHSFASLAAVTLRRKKVEDSLRESEQKYRLLAENVTDVIWTTDMEFHVTYASPSIFQLRGFTAEEVMRQKPEEAIVPQSLEVAISRVAEELAADNIAGADLNRNRSVEMEVYRKDGTTVWTENTFTFLRDEEQKPVGILAVTRDITERKKAAEQRLNLERQVLQTQELESLGILAGGIAHDFNNILSAVLGYSELALTTLSPQSPAQEYISEIEKAAKRAAALSRQMLAYSGRGKFVIELINLNDLVREMGHLLSVSVSKSVALHYNFTESIPLLEGDATQIRQVVMNLITNASEAIGEQSGVISISTGKMYCDRDYIKTCITPFRYDAGQIPAEGDYVFFEVTDTGCGMDQHVRELIFDPFYSTKLTGRGLGLAAVLGIIRGHKGIIKLYTELGKGSSFKVFLPASKAYHNVQTSSIIDRKTSSIGEGNLVLLVDDEESVRSVGQAMLERFGFKVITAEDGDQAISIFKQRVDEIDLIMLDMTMPRLDGEATFTELRKIREDIKVILSSGYNEQEATQRFTGRGLAGFLQKPYNLSQLSLTLEDVLNQPDQQTLLDRDSSARD